MNRTTVHSGVAVTLACAAGFAQSPATIQIGTASLYLGMSEQRVEGALPPPFNIQKQPTDTFSAWVITVQNAAGQFSWVGSLSFRHGRLSQVRRNWAPSDQQGGIPLAKALYGAVNQMITEGRRNCVLEAASQQDPRADQRAIFLQCSGKRLEIRIVEGEIGSGVTIEEVLEDRR